MARRPRPIRSHRHLSLALALTLAGACWGAPRVAAAVDASGVFATSGFSAAETVSIRQDGSSISLCVESGGFIGKLMEGTIDPATGVFHLALAREVFGDGFAWCSLTLTGTFAPDGATFFADVAQYTTCVPPPFTCQPGCVLTVSGPVAGTRTSTTPAPCCGDGTPDPGEECDDGNSSEADCCSGRCQLASAGNPCPPDADPCTSDQCDGAGVCTHTTIPACAVTTTTTTIPTTTTTTTLPATTCAASPLPGCWLSSSAKLKLIDRSPEARDRATWEWTKGAAPSTDFGDPRATTDYAFCLYEAFSVPVMSLRIPAGGTCSGKPCWKSAGTTGFAYRDRARASDGVAKLVLVSDPSGSAKISLRAKGDLVPLPALGGLDLPLVAQLQGNGRCWAATFFADRASSSEIFLGE